MQLYQSSVLNKYLATQDANEVAAAYEKYSTYFLNPEIQENIRNSKEEQFQEGFRRELFVNILGYTVIEGDTNSYVARLSLGLNLVTDWNYGAAGTEKFIDIVSTGDGFVAGGVRKNKGEGKYDCYIHHLDGNLATYAEETMGGATSERLNNLNLMASATDVWFAGHNIEWTINESGNAYLGATTLGFSSTGSSCEIPRVIFVDGIIDPTSGPYGAYKNGYGIGNSSYNLSTLQNIQSLNGNIIALYDIDRVLVDLEKGNLLETSQLVQYIKNFINQAT